MGGQAIDLIVMGFVALAAIVGMGFGALRATSGLICTGIIVTLMLLGYAPLATTLARLPGLNPRVTTILAFGLLAIVGQVIAVLTFQRPLGPLLGLLGQRRGLRRLDRLLGAVPGAIVGCLLAGLLLAPLAVAAPALGLGPALREARLASLLLEGDARFLQMARIRPLLQTAADTLALPSPVNEGEAGRELPFSVAATELAPDPAAEAQILALVNEERARVGLPALEFDRALVPVGHAHAVEMFERGYFAHESQVTGDPFDRLADANIAYLTAGENLAFAPDVVTAHRGLMDSPGHRANILSPKFGRAGMAVIRSRYHGLMIVQLFRN
ncbi:MAG: hypothetical protein AVDCRST_MAG18-326 [uncultured Thermomicrobiales bacterium]|uniref:SCP domain-containing protein n=1 Tax=uncultured Thermomicrobiales bacterium TaxID=1645740 RepID=A0A6J4UI83_9BACT|nr:MAG: hypothetical protein AVDCRST_MAG18-326 [uncultured Thermomicrobiales bacterium]